MPDLIQSYEDKINSIYWHTDVCLNLWDQRKKVTNLNAKHGLTLEVMDTANLEDIYESALVSAVVVWQSFAADWIVAAIVHDPSKLNEKLASVDLAKAQVGGFNLHVEPAKLRKNLNAAKVRQLLERPASNQYLRVNYESDWKKYQNLLAPQFRTKVNNLKEEDYAFLNLCTLIRNQSAHGSSESKKRVAEFLKDPTLKKLERADKVSLSKNHSLSKLGFYLAAEMPNPFGKDRQNTRLAYLLGKLRRLPAAKLV